MKYNKVYHKNSNIYIIKKFKILLATKGKQITARTLFSKVLTNLKNEKIQPFFVIKQAVSNIKVFFTITQRQKGKMKIIKPKPILRETKRISLALQWLINNSKKSSNTSVGLVKEIIDASLNKGTSKQQQQELNLIILANKKNITPAKTK